VNFTEPSFARTTLPIACGAPISRITLLWGSVPFADLASAERWVTRFVDWYNTEHRHSAIRYVTPNERHNGGENYVLARRHELYQQARLANPERWSRSTRNWSPVGLVTLNPERPARHAPA